MGILQRQYLKHQFTISYLDLTLSLTSSSEINKNRCSLDKVTCIRYGTVWYGTVWYGTRYHTIHYIKKYLILINSGIASSAEALWAHYSLPLPQMSAETNSTFLSLCLCVSKSRLQTFDPEVCKTLQWIPAWPFNNYVVIKSVDLNTLQMTCISKKLQNIM